MSDNQAQDLKLIPAEELQQMDLPELNYIVKDTLYEGLAILAGTPKSGKSWLALQLACSVVNGNDFLNRETAKSECLYLALEDSKRRLQNRINILQKEELLSDGLYIDIRCQRLDTGLILQLTNALKTHPNIKLIIIDTFQMIRGEIKKNVTLYGNDYGDVSILKSFADINHITILLIHHFRKMDGSTDIFDKISGSNGIVGGVDTLFALDRNKKTDKEAHFYMSGRDIESEELIIELNDSNNAWCLKGTVDEIDKEQNKEYYSSNPVIITIKKLLFESEDNTLIISAEELFKKIPQIAGVKPKQKKPSGITRLLGTLRMQMLEYDGIHYESPSQNGGSSGRTMYFCIPNRQKDIL